MPKLAITDIFGQNVTQTNNDLVVSKIDLATVGLIASNNNEGSDLLVALLKLAGLTATPTRRNNDFDILIAVNMNEEETPEYIDRTIGEESKLYERNVISVELDQLYIKPPINPMNF